MTGRDARRRGVEARPPFSAFDTRGYRTVDVRSGYGEWVATYERTVENAMDIELLETLRKVPWRRLRRAADLGCGTGRTAAWLRLAGVRSVDGVDLTPEMLALARSKGVYQRLVEADVSSTGLEAGAYDLVISCLVDDALRELQPLYREAWRLARPGGFHVLVGYHPHFIMAAGMPTHFNSRSGGPLAIETYVHPLSEHVTAALNAGWVLVEMQERFIDDAWLALKPKWGRFRNYPISMAFAWQKPEAGAVAKRDKRRAVGTTRGRTRRTGACEPSETLFEPRQDPKSARELARFTARPLRRTGPACCSRRARVRRRRDRPGESQTRSFPGPLTAIPSWS